MNDYLITLCLLTFYATVIHLSSGAYDRQSPFSGFFLVSSSPCSSALNQTDCTVDRLNNISSPSVILGIVSEPFLCGIHLFPGFLNFLPQFSLSTLWQKSITFYFPSSSSLKSLHCVLLQFSYKFSFFTSMFSIFEHSFCLYNIQFLLFIIYCSGKISYDFAAFFHVCFPSPFAFFFFFLFVLGSSTSNVFLKGLQIFA